MENFKTLIICLILSFNSLALAGPGDRGGGGAILCDQKSPELTDFWEASLRQPSLKPHIDHLRKMNEAQAVAFFADRLNQYYEGGSVDIMSALINRFLKGTKDALLSPGKVQVFSIDGTSHGMRISIRVDTSAINSNDSGFIFGLSESRRDCREERVALSNFVMGSAVRNTNSSLEIILRRAEVFEAMAPFDQIGLIAGHEVLLAFTKGRMDITQLEAMGRKDSAEIRQLNAWIAFSSLNNKLALRSYRPIQAQKVSCSAVSQNSKREDDFADRVNFDLFLETKGTLLEIKSYKDENVQYPNLARLNIPRSAFRLPPGLNLNVSSSEVGSSFDFRLNSFGSDKVQALIYKRVPRMDSSVKEEETEHVLSVERDADGKAILSIDNLRTKSNEFRGEILCYSLATQRK